MVITFIGHSSIFSEKDIKSLVIKHLLDHIRNYESIVCFLGGYGQFDSLCAHACKELKQINPRIQTVFVTPYITLSEQEKIKELKESGLYDQVFYPPIENTPLRYAISKRNEWMIKNSDLIIAYVNKNYGGAYKSLQLAKRQNKHVINICDLI